MVRHRWCRGNLQTVISLLLQLQGCHCIWNLGTFAPLPHFLTPIGNVLLWSKRQFYLCLHCWPRRMSQNITFTAGMQFLTLFSVAGYMASIRKSTIPRILCKKRCTKAGIYRAVGKEIWKTGARRILNKCEFRWFDRTFDFNYYHNLHSFDLCSGIKNSLLEINKVSEYLHVVVERCVIKWAAAQQNQQYGLCAQWTHRSAWASA